MEGIHHIHLRKRIHSKKEVYPHPNKFIRLFDKFLIIGAIIGPMMALPQILKIYIFQDATGISTISFSLYALFNIPWAFYGFLHKEKPIVIAYSLWFLVNLSIVIGSLVY